MKRMLITGATGFLGKNFLECLDKEKYDVHIMQREGLFVDGIVCHKADILDKDLVADIVRKVQADILLLFAWDVETSAYWHSIANHKWADATLSLAEHFWQGGVNMLSSLGHQPVMIIPMEFYWKIKRWSIRIPYMGFQNCIRLKC